MSQLESAAQRVLTPLILGEPGTVEPADQAVIALWAQKTALTAMLVSSREQRALGYGLSQTEYTALYEHRSLRQPLPASRFWVGRYQGPAGFWAVHVTPLTVRIPAVADPDTPQAYAMTIVLGELVLHGLRFTTPALEFDVTTDLGMPQLWPSHGPVTWPAGQPCTEASFLPFASGKGLKPALEQVQLRPWAHATELPRSAVVDGKVRVPALCGEHFVSYPIRLLEDALRGRFHAFVTACECSTAYLVQTESDGAHYKAAGAMAGIAEMFEDLPGEEVLIRDEVGVFFCKAVAGS